MGLFDKLRDLFGGKPARRNPPPLPPPPIPSRPPAGRSPVAAAPARQAPAARKLNLDLGQFAPLTNAEAKKQARGLGSLWGNPWFGRRDLIPPVTDPRTLLIDRALVGQGLLTPEQLAEIHDIGDQMEKVRPDLAQASAVADEAVRRSDEERKALKEQKKAAAAARKQKHAEDVARRQATDIVFLGRGVSGGLSDRRSNLEKLQRLQLPALCTPVDLANALNLPIHRLRWLAFHSEASAVTHYVRFQVPKRTGGTRELAAPHRDIAACQQWILLHIIEKIPLHDSAHGFVPGRSTMSNAVPHVRRAVLVNADLKDFFPSITFPRVKGVFQELGYSPAIATVLALLCTECPRRQVAYAGRTLHVATGPRALPQGACTSPGLSNLVARRLDSRLAGLAKKLGWDYTRYADDLTLSTNGDATRLTAYVLARLRHIASEENFTVNEKKTRVQRPNTAQTVTGIVVNERPNVPRDLRRRLRAILHQAKKEGLAAQNREGRENFEAWLGGMISYIIMVNPDRGRQFKRQFEEVL